VATDGGTGSVTVTVAPSGHVDPPSPLSVTLQQHASEGLETRLDALEDSYALAQKQVGVALATAEQLKTSELPTQVLSLHTEMRARLAEMRQASVSPEQLSQLQAALRGKSDEFEGVRIQVGGLAALSAELSREVRGLAGGAGEAESRLEETAGRVAALSATLDGRAAEVLGLKERLDAYRAQLEASTLEMAAVRWVGGGRGSSLCSCGGNSSLPLAHNFILTLSKPL